jgi:hypothetical protein
MPSCWSVAQSVVAITTRARRHKAAAGSESVRSAKARSSREGSSLTEFARRERVRAASLTAIGAFERAVLGFFDLDRRDYDHVTVDEQVEVVSLLGDLSLGVDGAPMLHAHVVVARRDGNALGGHLLEGVVRPTLEIVVSETDVHLQRRYDERSGLALIALDEP